MNTIHVLNLTILHMSDTYHCSRNRMGWNQMVLQLTDTYSITRNSCSIGTYDYDQSSKYIMQNIVIRQDNSENSPQSIRVNNAYTK